MTPLEGDEKEIIKVKRLKILTPNKLLTRLPMLLVQMKAQNNSNKLKNESRQILYLIYQHFIIMEENMIVIRDLEIFCFHYDRPKDVDKNLKHEIKFIIKSNKSLVENKIENDI